MEVYDLHQHTHYFRKTTIDITCTTTSTRETGLDYLLNERDSCITYDEQKLNVLSWGSESVDIYEDSIKIDVSEETLYGLFKKDEDKWDQDDVFLFTAVSDFIRISVEEIIDDPNHLGVIKDRGALHYVFVVQSEWEEEIREVLIRPIFVQAKLISKNDHRDRLLFCSDVESICYYLTDSTLRSYLEIASNAIFSRIIMVNENRVLIKLDLVSIKNPLFDFSGSLLFSKTMASVSMSLTSNDVKNCIGDFIKIKFSFDAQEKSIQNIMEKLCNDIFIYTVSHVA
ncbi:hypothetical protein HPULCUR_002704 [Helicostylum pulchrum]|uniref:Uncharacterized protein n=1 Tax=Helicostylum pulchrum TaxID=562976 RepID=A0ABP9XRC6_9FUNG